MPRKAYEREGGTWTDIDLSTTYQSTVTNRDAIAAQEVADAAAFATTAQGALADTALQAADVGTAAAADTGDFATAAQGVLVDNMKLAMSGSMALRCTPATLGSSAATVNADIAGGALKFVRTVDVTLETVPGARHTWYSGTHDAAAVATTAGDGTCALAAAATTITFVAGIATATIEYIGTWAAADLSTLTVVDGEIMGQAVGDTTSIDTLVA